MSIFPPASPQGPAKPALAPIDSGVPSAGGNGSSEVVLPGRPAPTPANSSKTIG